MEMCEQEKKDYRLFYPCPQNCGDFPKLSRPATTIQHVVQKHDVQNQGVVVLAPVVSKSGDPKYKCSTYCFPKQPAYYITAEGKVRAFSGTASEPEAMQEGRRQRKRSPPQSERTQAKRKSTSRAGRGGSRAVVDTGRRAKLPKQKPEDNLAKQTDNLSEVLQMRHEAELQKERLSAKQALHDQTVSSMQALFEMRLDAERAKARRDSEKELQEQKLSSMQELYKSQVETARATAQRDSEKEQKDFVSTESMRWFSLFQPATVSMVHSDSNTPGLVIPRQAREALLRREQLLSGGEQ